MMLASMAAMTLRNTAALMALPAEPASQSPFVAHASNGLPLKDAPINADWIISGNPVARCAEHSRGHDDAAVTAIWDCTAGKFRWHFDWDETVTILEGEVHVTGEDGSERTLRTGDVAFFPGGTSAVWNVETYVRKVAFLRRPFPRPIAFAYRLRKRMRGTSGSSMAA